MAVPPFNGLSPLSCGGLVAVRENDDGCEHTKHQCRKRRRTNDEQVSQNGAEHGAKKEACAKDLTAAEPKESRAADFNQPCDISKPLAEAHGLKGLDHHLGASEFRQACCEEGEGKQHLDDKQTVFLNGWGHCIHSIFGGVVARRSQSNALASPA